MLIGDTDNTEELLQDEEIQFLLSDANNNVYVAGWRACELIAAEYARKAQRSVGGSRDGITLFAQQKYAQYSLLAKQLKAQSYKRNMGVYAGGLSISDKISIEDDDDRVQPVFVRDLEQYPGSDADESSGSEEQLSPQ